MKTAEKITRGLFEKIPFEPFYKQQHHVSISGIYSMHCIILPFAFAYEKSE